MSDTAMVPTGSAIVRIRAVWERTKDLPTAERIEQLEAERRAVETELELTQLESLHGRVKQLGESLTIPSGPVNLDQTGVLFDVGHDAHRLLGSQLHQPLNEETLTHVRDRVRHLVRTNSFAFSALRNRQNYCVGTGIKWRLIPRPGLELKDVKKGLMEEANRRLEKIMKVNRWRRFEREAVLRADRDGERIVRIFPQGKEGPALVRFVDPERITSPMDSTGEPLSRAHLGVEFKDLDACDRIAIWIRPDGRGVDGMLANPPRRTPMFSDNLPGNVGRVQLVHYLTKNVDLCSPRGWPLLWACFDNLRRADKILEASTFVATIQASIALIRKHKRATKGEVENLLQAERDLLIQRVRQDGSRKDESFQFMRPGTMIDHGPGYDFEAPISSVEAGKNAILIEKELQAAAACVQQAEYMLSANAQNANFSSTLVAEAPTTKGFQTCQAEELDENEAILFACMQIEVSMRGLDEAALEELRLEGEPPSLIVRDQLQETQGNQILHSSRVLSTTTWRAKVGLQDEVEQMNLDREAKRDPPPDPDAPENGDRPPSPGGRDNVQGERPPTEPARAGPAPTPAAATGESSDTDPG